ncbi:hypothetical protein H0E84_12865 [Luteimonas sp. SJ-92]|uniref:PRC-barrel domain containing protein n=1 Tax=Luteimonas salinisoli TaxID=2752307 RepID=A0A853JEK2_9GAMM|nr:hypothetical protein [Luteimonas salinisoli]NZA27275.1 hypothetical protein [Luteimonas salinisoli]
MPDLFRPLSSRLLLALVLATAATACSGPAAPGAGAATAQAELDPILADPQPGDLYAAEVTHFSGVSFGDNEDRKAYGLMKVREVTADQVMVITEMGAWPKGRGAVNELRGDLSEITWDEQEVIPLYRNELAGLVADGKILEVRRLDAE